MRFSSVLLEAILLEDILVENERGCLRSVEARPGAAVSVPPPVFIGSPVRVESTKISDDRQSLRILSDQRTLKAGLTVRGDGVNVSLKITAEQEMTEAECVAVLRWCRARWPSPIVLRTVTLQIK